jgi:hypothetical protein
MKRTVPILTNLPARPWTRVGERFGEQANPGRTELAREHQMFLRSPEIWVVVTERIDVAGGSAVPGRRLPPRRSSGCDAPTVPDRSRCRCNERQYAIKSHCRYPHIVLCNMTGYGHLLRAMPAPAALPRTRSLAPRRHPVCKDKRRTFLHHIRSYNNAQRR